MISIVRCDDRLIHGQTMTRVVHHYKVKEILVVDDYTSKNPILKSIFKSAVPSNMSAEILSTEEALEILPNHINNDVSTMVIFKSPLTALSLFEKYPQLSTEMMVGPVAMRDGSKEIVQGTYFTPDEIDAVNNLEEMGVEVYFQVVPDNKKTTWKNVKHKLK